MIHADSIPTVYAAGVHRLGDNRTVTVDSRFHIGSLAKPMTTTLAAMLVERGVIGWDTTVDEVFVEAEIHPGLRGVTLEQLLGHMAGLAPCTAPDRVAAVPGFEGGPVDQRRAFARWILAREPLHEPGRPPELYSNAGFAVAAAMIEARAGQSWEALLRSQLFEPLGMDSAGFGWPAAGGAAEPWGHWPVDGALHPHDPDGGYRLPAWMGPGGDVHMDIRDLAAFAQFHLRALRGHENPLMSNEAVRHLHAPVSDHGALGWGLTPLHNHPVSVHAGSGGTFYAVILVSPGQDRALVMVVNGADRGIEQRMHDWAERLLGSRLYWAHER